jgi:hypothetical protein
MTDADPFADSSAWTAIVRDLEPRWGLTLVSFLPGKPAEAVRGIQQRLEELGSALYPSSDEDGPLMQLYATAQLHCTHLTLTRSDPWGPIRLQDFVKPQSDPLFLFTIVARIAAAVGPINVRLDSLEMSDDRVGLRLNGQCSSIESLARRAALLRTANTELERHFNLSRRPWDTDPTEHGNVHVRIGFLKRRPSSYADFRRAALALKFEPIEAELRDISIVHHRFRSLLFPQQGLVTRPLGGSAPQQYTNEQFLEDMGWVMQAPSGVEF